MTTTKDLPDTFPGRKYHLAIQASADAILAEHDIRRPVRSSGTRFMNVDRWTGEIFVHKLTDWLAENPNKVPNKGDLQNLVYRANRKWVPDPYISVARMPQRVNHRVALAVIGGGYHEAWHTKYSKRDTLNLHEVEFVQDLIAKVVDQGGTFDAKMRGLLKTIHHLVEDIRIERRGNEDYPGARQPMCDLQDFILDMEMGGRLKGALAQNINVTSNARSILLCAFRDLGLGYNTQKAKEALAFYKEVAPEAVALVSQGGLLRPYVEAAKGLSREDQMGSLRIGLEVVVTLWEATQVKPDNSPKPEKGCPACGADPSNLLIKGVRDENGVKIKGLARQICKACGHVSEYMLPDTSLSLNQTEAEETPEEGPKPEVEDLDRSDMGEHSDGFGDDSQEHAKDNPQQNQAVPNNSPPKEETEDDPDSEDAGSETAPGAEPEASEEGEDEESSDPAPGSQGNGAEGQSDAEGDDENAMGESEPDSWNNGDEGDDWEEGEDDSAENGTHGNPGMAGGHKDAGDSEQINDVKLAKDTKEAQEAKTADAVLDGEENDGPLTSSTALEAAIKDQNDKNLDPYRDENEKLWNPAYPELDVARFVRPKSLPSGNGLENAQRKARKMHKDVQAEITMMRARLRNIVRALEQTDTEHGLRRGKKLSDRMLVDSRIDLLGGQDPTRPYQDRDTQLDTSIAMAVCVDQSGSMAGSEEDSGKLMMVLTEPLEAIQGKTFVFGFRDGKYQYPPKDGQDYHRAESIRYDVFKAWDERYDRIKWRFARVTAQGGTPMADGIQYGLTALNGRNEAHRILTVITDGEPNGGHLAVMNYQIRKAREAGIHVLGIGLGRSAKYVQTVFPDHIWVEKISDAPKAIIAKLNELCDFSGRNRGKRIQGLGPNAVRRIL